ncbi:hypothetical protein LOAG_11067 [Loa loa]|uniref:Uncharacterized protein n=1 Tax=Loa loa TaxID=7209 RepID=A0A1S0TP73_LOALO|nr:hypothetical protein LOAG_11067 [Loa loa]EFO17431.1 hypothetical protein LOAG_11067 [Loa loa]
MRRNKLKSEETGAKNSKTNQSYGKTSSSSSSLSTTLILTVNISNYLSLLTSRPTLKAGLKSRTDSLITTGDIYTPTRKKLAEAERKKDDSSLYYPQAASSISTHCIAKKPKHCLSSSSATDPFLHLQQYIYIYTSRRFGGFRGSTQDETSSICQGLELENTFMHTHIDHARDSRKLRATVGVLTYWIFDEAENDNLESRRQKQQASPISWGATKLVDDVVRTATIVTDGTNHIYIHISTLHYIHIDVSKYHYIHIDVSRYRSMRAYPHTSKCR